MEFRILGPLEVISNGQTIDLGGAKQRALLAVLLLDANDVISNDRLIDGLWEDDPPETAHKALQVYISGLRKLVGKERLQTRSPGYLLEVGEDELDLDRFRRLRKEGRLVEALALWRGPPLADFSYRRFAQAEIARLEDLRLACVEERIEQDLQAGRHVELTGELEALVAEHPLRERPRGQLMLALYRSGRQAEALEAYQSARGTLVEELGIEPGRELRELHQKVLNQDPALELPTEKTQPQSDQPEVEETRETVDREVRKTITALYADVRVVSAQGRSIDPEALRRVTRSTLDLVGAAVERHGGVVETIAGTTVTILFGLPAVHEDDALRAVRAGREVQDQLSARAAEGEGDAMLALDVRIGIATGEVVAGGEGNGIGVVGEPLTRSPTLAHAADEGTILIDGPTRLLLREAVDVEPVGDAWRVVDVLVDRGAPIRLVSPMVGRERERRRLRDVFDQAAIDHSCQLFTVLGSAGVGKSRLVHEFLGDISDRALIARGRCLPYGEGITYWPLLEVVKDAVGLQDDDSPDVARAKLVAALAEDGADTAALHVSETIGLAEAATSGEEGFASVQALFEALARRRPLVVVFDDIHWAQPTFLDLVEYLVDWTRDVPILLICLARPELLDVRPGWGGGKVNATSILLEPLSRPESDELIRNLASDALAEPTRQRIADTSEGNPLFVEEMLALALEGGAEAEELVVPPTIHALLAARLDRLTDDERSVIECAAVAGKVFYEHAIAELARAELRPGVAAALGSLLRKELIRPDRPSLGGHTYRFRHLLIRDAAYESIPKEGRSRLHEQFGRWLERAAGDRATEYEEVVGYHLEQAYRYQADIGPVDEAARCLAREAAERLGAAGRRAFGRSDAPAGVNLISRAVALLPADDPLRVELVPNVRVVQGVGADMDWAERVLTEAIETAATTGDRGLAAHALVQRGFLRLFTGPDVTVEELLDTAERAIAAFETLHDELGLARGWRLRAQAYYLARCAALSADASERALAHAQRAGDRFEEREIVEWLVIALLWGPVATTEGASRCGRLLAECAGDPGSESLVLGALALFATMSGRLDESRELAAEARRTLGELGEGVWIVSFHLAEACVWQGDAAGAEAELRPLYEMLKRIGEKSHFSAMAQLLADAVYRQGRLEEAEQLTVECELAARANDVHDQIRWRAVRAKVLAGREPQAAEMLARQAVALAHEGDFVTARAGALMDLAEVLHVCGRRDEATAAAQEAIRDYELKGNVLAADQARTRLETLGA